MIESNDQFVNYFNYWGTNPKTVAGSQPGGELDLIHRLGVEQRTPRICLVIRNVKLTLGRALAADVWLPRRPGLVGDWQTLWGK